MGTRKSMKMITIILGLMGTAFLTSVLTISSVGWIPDVLFKFVGVNPEELQTAKHEGESGITALMQLAKNLPAATQDAPEEVEAKKHPLPPGKPEGRLLIKPKTVQ